jgi:alkylated DNA repair dioxygenase AlkB
MNEHKKMTSAKLDLERHELQGGHMFFSGSLPGYLVLNESQFAGLWAEHPNEYHRILIHGRLVDTPRWQQAYGKDYHYTGRTNSALPLLPELTRLLAWFQSVLDERLNGVLVNWYDGELGHYIGKHRDSTKNMVVGAPIVTISFGESRIFRVRPWKGKGHCDFSTVDGAFFVMPYETNLANTHEVLRRASATGKRISVTLRAFQP